MKAPLKRLVRSPVAHFVLAGVILFALAALFVRDRAPSSGTPADSSARASGAGSDDPSTIRVERDGLIAFVQSRTRMARAEDAARAFDAASDAVRRDWIDRYVREEALVREARSLGLDSADELIRRRLVQQMEFLVEGVGEGALTVTDAEVEALYAKRARELREPATVRFAHVFVKELAGFERESFERARVILAKLNRDRIAFDEAYGWGDRFLYDRTYVDRTLDEVRSHFGDEFAKTITKLAPDPGRWTGPHRSQHGLHLVMLTGRKEARQPTLEEVAGVLREELLREKREQAVERGVEAIVAKYRVDLGDGVRSPGK